MGRTSVGQVTKELTETTCPKSNLDVQVQVNLLVHSSNSII